jgi:hypothetical protein
MCGVSTASFVRAVALGEKLKVVADQRAVLELIRLRADMGRLGGLLKLWLTNEERFDKERSELSVADVRDVLHRIEATEEQCQIPRTWTHPDPTNLDPPRVWKIYLKRFERSFLQVTKFLTKKINLNNRCLAKRFCLANDNSFLGM